jgi:hypothetical protein
MMGGKCLHLSIRKWGSVQPNNDPWIGSSVHSATRQIRCGHRVSLGGHRRPEKLFARRFAIANVVGRSSICHKLAATALRWNTAAS